MAYRGPARGSWGDDKMDHERTQYPSQNQQQSASEISGASMAPRSLDPPADSLYTGSSTWENKPNPPVQDVYGYESQYPSQGQQQSASEISGASMAPQSLNPPTDSLYAGPSTSKNKPNPPVQDVYGYESSGESSGLESEPPSRQYGAGYASDDTYSDLERARYDYEDDDSLYQHSYTTSLSPSVLEYQYENGRRYHCYREGQYVLPNDEKEQDRLDLLHHVFRMILGGELHLAPVENPKRILDLGTGTGIWAIDMADEHPEAEVIGNDLSAIQPNNVPPNLTFEIDDVEGDWPYLKPFDFIHCRILGGAITDWPALYAKAFQHCSPGGWFEVTDYRMRPYSEDGREDFVMREVANLFAEALGVIGKPSDVAHLHRQGMIDAGFINVQERVEVVPFSAWPADKKMKLLGMYHMHSIADSIHSYGLAPLTRILGMSKIEAEVLLASARAEVLDPKNKLYSLLHFVIGQKPPAITSPVSTPGWRETPALFHSGARP